MTISKTMVGVMAAMAVSAPAFAHHEATFTTSPNASTALLIGGAVLVSAIIVAVVIKAMKKKA